MEQAVDNWVKELKETAKDNINFMGMNEQWTLHDSEIAAKKLQKEMDYLINDEMKRTSEMYGFSATHLGYPPSEHNNFNQNEAFFERPKYKWWEIYLAVSFAGEFAFLYLPWVLCTGKNSSIKKLEKYTDKCEKEFKKIIDIMG